MEKLDFEQTSWGSYPKIYHVGHRVLRDIFNDYVTVEEKVDGSQFSFGRYDTPDGPELRIKSKGAMIYKDSPPKMFQEIVDYVVSIENELVMNWKYVGEYLQKPAHNSLLYNRIPKNHLIIFDICPAHEYYLGVEEKEKESARLGFEIVPLLLCSRIADITLFRNLLNNESVLGGTKIEGVVIKNYLRFGPDGKALMGKFVSEAFKEIHNKTWNETNPGQGDAIDKIGKRYQTQARWQKAVQHLRDSDQLELDPRDIGNLLNEVKKDVGQECKEEIKQLLWKAFGPKVIRIATAGLPEWYKGDYLVKQQFEEDV